MQKTKSKILLAVFLIILLLTSYSLATNETTADPISTTSETTSTDQSNWVNSDLLLSEDKVTISNVVDGNAFVAAKEVTVSGEIGGDLFVIADKLNIEGGYVYSSIFACANEITINGVVYDVYAICNTFNLESNGFIYRDMKINGSTININGKVRRDAYLSANNINLNAEAGTLIYGDLNYCSNSEISIPEGAVTGETTYSKLNTTVNNNSVGITILNYVLSLVKTLLFTFVIAMILLWLTPKFVERLGKMGVAKSFVSLGIGFATPIAFVIASVLLILSIVGVQLFTLGMFAFIILAYIGFSVASIFFGKLFTKLLKMEGNVKFVLFTLLSTFILWALGQIPVVGWLFSLIIALFGIGATLVNMVWKKEKEDKKVEVKE